METQKKKKGQALAGISQAALYIGIAVFVVAIIITLLSTLQDTQVTNTAGCNSTDTFACGAAYNATGSGITGLATFNDFWSVLVLIVILAIVITALYAVFPSRTVGYD